MTIGSVLSAVLGFVLLVVAHYTLRPLVGGPVTVDFLALAVLFSAARIRPGGAAVMGCVAGLAVDAMAPHAFGAATVAFPVVAFTASRLKAAVFSENLALTGAVVFAGAWAFTVLYILLARVRSGGSLRGDLLGELLVRAPLSAALTALVGMVLLLAFRPLFRGRVGSARHG